MQLRRDPEEAVLLEQRQDQHARRRVGAALSTG
jgi:hypothetical protein